MSYLSQNITLDNFSTILQATDNLKEESKNIGEKIISPSRVFGTLPQLP